MPARPFRTRPANGNSLADQVARNVQRMGGGSNTPILVAVPGLKYFHRVPARLLRDFSTRKGDYGSAKAGAIGEVQLMPTGCFYLDGPHKRTGEMISLSMDASDGVDFDFVSERL